MQVNKTLNFFDSSGFIADSSALAREWLLKARD